jgi:putative ATP-dependent endonuclease of the OLD family
MKIAEVRIQNLRGYHDQTVPLNDYTCLVGANGVGKSTILCALCIFFRDSEHFATNLHCLQQEDFHCLKTDSPITITVTFTDLSPEAQDDFKEYYRQGKLVISATAIYDPETKMADVKQSGQRKVMKAFRSFFAADGDKKPVAYLKTLYEEIRKSLPDLPEAGPKGQMTDALRSYENAHPDQCELVRSSDQFYGFSSGVNRLAKYIQWVYVPAVKDATTEQTEAKATSLGKLLARTVRSKINFAAQLAAIRSEATEKYLQLLDANQGSLQDISGTLRERLKDWAHPDARVKLEWRGTPEKAIRVDEPLAQIVAGEGGFDGELSRFGHGLQRCYILALLQELSGNTDDTGPKLILGCEEPELHQHPPQARHLADVLFQLSKRNSQVIVSTHSPYFVSGERFADVRLIRKDTATHRASVSYVTMWDLAATIAHAKQEKPAIPDALALKMQQALLPSLNELFFTRVVVLVEGLEDIAYITAYFNLLDLWEEFRRQGCHLVSADSKSHILQPLAIAKHLNIPTFAVFDSDGDKPDKNGSRTKHEKDNKALLRLRGYESQSPFPADTFWERDTVMWNSDIGTVVHTDLGAGLQPILNKVRAKFGNVGGLDKTAMFISSILAEAWEAPLRSPNLEKLCLSILEFAKRPFAVA